MIILQEKNIFGIVNFIKKYVLGDIGYRVEFIIFILYSGGRIKLYLMISWEMKSCLKYFEMVSMVYIV